MENSIIQYLPENLRNLFSSESGYLESLTEIRLRVKRPIILKTNTVELSLTPMGDITQSISQGYIITATDIAKTMELISDFSLYAFENELKNGYITIPGGHRIGICGTTVIENGHIKTIKNFSGINIRLCRQIFGVGEQVIEHIVTSEGRLLHTMIISPPACGKTTLLRDIVRQLSYGVEGKFEGMTVGVVDERSEIAGTYQGVYQNDIGPRTDVMDACPKAVGMVILLRAMSPKVIAVDELGKQEDIQALEDIVNSGVKVICTVHGNNVEEIKKRDNLKYIFLSKLFERYIILGEIDQAKKLSNIEAIYDKNFQKIG